MKKTSIVTAGVALGAASFPAKSYGRIIGANERMNFGIVGLHGRANGHLTSLAMIKNTAVTHICDVDKRELETFSAKTESLFASKPVMEKDIRIMLESKDIDAITIATPEHWHTPMAIMGMQAGKHVYVEKPLSHNPAEGELLVEAQKKYGKTVQMGNQQRSSAHTIDIMKKIHEGIIGKAYYGKAWYANSRRSIGRGKKVSVPDYLDWDLWQGPAPRRDYMDNYHPYNWHWFWHWGTGETLNNGTHEVDLCRWALEVDFPKRITAEGGRYHFGDDWQFYDTLNTSFEYDGKLISWEGNSCNGKRYFNRGRGATIHGTEGTVLLDRNGYEIYNTNDEMILEFKKEVKDATTDTIGAGPMTTAHIQNFINAIKINEKQNSPVHEGNISVTMLQLSNIAWKMKRSLKINPKNGHILRDRKAMKMWSREYEKGWEVRI